MEMIFGQLCFTKSQNNSLPQLRVHLMSALECVVHCKGVGVKKNKINKIKGKSRMYCMFNFKLNTAPC